MKRDNGLSAPAGADEVLYSVKRGKQDAHFGVLGMSMDKCSDGMQ